MNNCPHCNFADKNWRFGDIFKKINNINNLNVDVKLCKNDGLGLFTLNVEDEELYNVDHVIKFCPMCGRDLYEVTEEPLLLTYYLVFEKYQSNSTTKSWLVRKTKHDLDTSDGIIALIKELEEIYGCPIWIINWKLLK